MKKIFTIFGIIFIAGISFFGGYSLFSQGQGAGAVAPVASTDTVSTLRTNFNDVVAWISASTSSLGSIAALSSSTGNLIVGSSSAWTTKAVGANGFVLTASSTAAGGINWEPSAGGVSTSTANTWGALQTFQNGIVFTTATGTSATSTLNVANASTTNLFVGALTASRLVQSSAAGVLASVSNLASWIAGTTSELTVADDGDGSVTLSLPTIVDLGASSELRVVSSTISGALTVVNVSSTNLNAATRISADYSTASRCARFDADKNLVAASGDCASGDTGGGGGASSTIPFIIEFPRNNENLLVHIFNVTTTLSTFLAVNTGGTGDTVTFNVGWTTTSSAASSTWNKLFTADQTVSATTSSVSLAINGSSTPDAKSILKFYTTAASSSGFMFVIGY